jgi:hypothetical protein
VAEIVKKRGSKIPEAANMRMYTRDFHESCVMRHAMGNMTATEDALLRMAVSSMVQK